MALFPVIAESVQISIDTPVASDAWKNGVLVNSANTLVRGVNGSGNQYNNGLSLTTDGQVSYVDATSGLPAGTQWTNGIPMSGGAVCISTGPVATYSNGLPFAANGALAATVSL